MHFPSTSYIFTDRLLRCKGNSFIVMYILCSYRLMLMCWRKYASERPRFEEICRYLDTIMEDMKRESYCESDSDEGETLSREGSKRFPTRSPSIKSGTNLFSCVTVFETVFCRFSEFGSFWKQEIAQQSPTA